MIRQRLRPFTPQLSGLVAACLLGAMGFIMLGSAWEDALTMDEPIHLIGVRHLLPVFPFTMILVGCTIGRWINPLPGTADGPIPGVEHGGGRRPPLAGDQCAARVPVLPRVRPRSGRRASRGGGATLSAIPTGIVGKIDGGCGRLSTRTTRGRSRWTPVAAAR
jgi:hypothetical protein